MGQLPSPDAHAALADDRVHCLVARRPGILTPRVHRGRREGAARFPAPGRCCADGQIWASSDRRSASTAPPNAEIISLLLGTGEFSHGLRPVVDLSAATDPEERRTLLLDYCDRVAAVLDQRFLPGAGKKDHPQVFANFRHRSQVATTPLTIDLAEEMRAELLALRRTIESASPSGPGADPIDLDDSFVF